jgi:hypothetical protein
MRFGVTLSKMRLVEGQRIPRGFGIAWWRPETAEAFCLPIPFNWIAGWARRAWMFLMCGPKNKQDARIAEAYRRGIMHGREDGEKIGYRSGFAEGKAAGVQAALGVIGDYLLERNANGTT